MAEAAEKRREREGRSRELETEIISRVGQVSSAIDTAKHADDVVSALHSLAVLLFPLDSSLLSDDLDERFRDEIINSRIPADSERDEWRDVFYRGVAFPAMANILLYNVASNWLSNFPCSARERVYDSFFVKGPVTEVLQSLVSGLQRSGTNKNDHKAVYSNIERLLVLCLLENEGVYHIVGEFGLSYGTDENVDLLMPEKVTLISRVAQLLASIPDKARYEASSMLSSHFFFQKIIIQLLQGVEDRAMELQTKDDVLHQTSVDAAFLFVGETFSRICRRGSADVLLHEMLRRIISHVRSCLSSDVSSVAHMIESSPKSQYWLKIVETMKDKYAIERLSEELLHQVATKNVSDEEAYWLLWMLFHDTFKHQVVMRSMFVDKFLFWKVFPLCCLRWILQFSVLEHPPNAGTKIENQKAKGFLDTLQRLVKVWSKREFVQSATMEQQAYVTAAVGWCIERMSKEELEKTKDVLNSILQGVSCRLESPIHLVRKMASAIALAFSKVVDPKNPLYLDDNCSESIDWEFGILSHPKETKSVSHISKINHDKSQLSFFKGKKSSHDSRRQKDVNGKIANGNGNTNFSEFKMVDHDEIIDPTMVSSSECFSDKEGGDYKSDDSETSSVSSLQPYDLSDDDTDLQKKFSQLGDISSALRKPDDPESVERALDVAEKLIRVSPDELHHNSRDLVSALVHVRCSDVTIEGEEDSAEEKRQKALVALLVTCTFESLDVLTKLLYSSSVDVSQRILIIDIMTDAALELADAKTIVTKHHQRDLITPISGSHPWFIPSSRGPLGAGPWKEVSDAGGCISWSHRYERELPSRPGQIKMGKPRRWSTRKPKDYTQVEWSKNKFPLYAAAFMLPVMQGFDKRRHGVDLLNRDFIVLGKLIYMLGVCMKCMSLHPEASALAPALLDMLRSRDVSNHNEAYVRRSALFAASCILVALHPSYLASALIEGNQEISEGLEWIRIWALHVAESDPDTECSTMAMACLQSHAEMALQTSRVLESADSFKTKTGILPPKMGDIIIPSSNIGFQV